MAIPSPPLAMSRPQSRFERAVSSPSPNRGMVSSSSSDAETFLKRLMPCAEWASERRKRMMLVEHSSAAVRAHTSPSREPSTAQVPVGVSSDVSLSGSSEVAGGG